MTTKERSIAAKSAPRDEFTLSKRIRVGDEFRCGMCPNPYKDPNNPGPYEAPLYRALAIVEERDEYNVVKVVTVSE